MVMVMMMMMMIMMTGFCLYHVALVSAQGDGTALQPQKPQP